MNRYPKLWNGPNPVGEAKVRALQQVSAPFLRASGPGFESGTMNGLSEVKGERPKLYRGGIVVALEEMAFNAAATNVYSAWSDTGAVVGETGDTVEGQAPARLVFNIRGDMPLGEDPLGDGTVRIYRQRPRVGHALDLNAIPGQHLLSYDRFEHALYLCGRRTHRDPLLAFPDHPAGHPCSVAFLFTTGLDVSYYWQRKDLRCTVFMGVYFPASSDESEVTTLYLYGAHMRTGRVAEWVLLDSAVTTVGGASAAASGLYVTHQLDASVPPRSTYAVQRRARFVDGASFLAQITESAPGDTGLGFTGTLSLLAPAGSPSSTVVAVSRNSTASASIGSLGDTQYKVPYEEHSESLTQTSTPASPAQSDPWDGTTYGSGSGSETSAAVTRKSGVTSVRSEITDTYPSSAEQRVPTGSPAPTPYSEWRIPSGAFYENPAYVAPSREPGERLLLRRLHVTTSVTFVGTEAGEDVYTIGFTTVTHELIGSGPAQDGFEGEVTVSATGAFGSVTATRGDNYASWPALTTSYTESFEVRSAISYDPTAGAALRQHTAFSQTVSASVSAGGVGNTTVPATWSIAPNVTAFTVQFDDGTTISVSAGVSALFDRTPKEVGLTSSSIYTLHPDNFIAPPANAGVADYSAIYDNALNGLGDPQFYESGGTPPAGWDHPSYAFTHTWSDITGEYLDLADWVAAPHGRKDEAFMRKPDGTHYPGFLLRTGLETRSTPYNPFSGAADRRPLRDFATYFIADPRTGGFVLQVSWLAEAAGGGTARAHRLYLGNRFGIVPLTPVLNAWLAAVEGAYGAARSEDALMIGYNLNELTLV